MTTPTAASPTETVDPPSPKKAFTHAYWMLNSIEMFERLAYFGIRAVVPLYIMQATEPGGLHLTATDKGFIYAWWAVFQSILPVFTGGYADRYGYKRVLVFAITMNALGYIMMANLHDKWGFFAGIIVLATGTAFFKPSLQGSIAQNLTKANSSVGWGVFYWVVNVGAFAAPFLSTAILGKPHSRAGWDTLFYTCAAFTCVNLLLLLTFRDVPSGADKSIGMREVLARTIENIWPYWLRGGRFHPVRTVLGLLLVLGGVVLLMWKPFAGALWAGLGLAAAGAGLATWLQGGKFTWQLRLPAWLLIMSCFWLMMYQLWDLHPNFITDWIDSSSVAGKFHSDAWPWRLFWEYGDRGALQVPQQILLNVNAGLIILLMVPLSWLARKMRTLSAMLVGMSVATVGVLVAGLTGNGWVFILGVVFFSLGEMWTGPKKNEYLGLIAPPGKKGLYLGYVNIPVGVGLFVGSQLAGWLYNNWGEKATLALKELGSDAPLVARAAQATDWSDSLEKIPDLAGIEREAAFELAQADLGADVSPEAAAQVLLGRFRHDRGQIANLGYLYLAEHDEFADKVRARLTEELQKGDGQGKEGQAKPTTTVLAGYLHRMSDWIGKSPVEVFELVRECVNNEQPAGQELGDTEIVALLWNRFGEDPGILNNLALEYLAQHTSRVAAAVERLAFDDPVEDIPKQLAIDRPRAFAALSAARGATSAQIDAALSELDTSGGATEDRLYVYLVGRHHLRFNAIAERDWTRDVTFLRAAISEDAAARRIVEEKVDVLSWFAGLTRAVKRLFTGDEDEKDPYERLAPNQDLIQEALAAKDWGKTPQQAAYLLRLNPDEARARVAAEVANSAAASTRLLWDKYRPQYGIWLPIAAIGVAATIALGVFGQMAKRWKDMNA